MNLLDFLLSLSKDQQDLVCLAFEYCLQNINKKREAKP
jgi:hypothetical protein